MCSKNWKIIIWLFGLIGTSSTVYSQELGIELGKKNIALDEPFTITLVIRNAQAQNVHSPFPDIAGMEKRELAQTNSKEEFNGKNIISQRITQYYLAAKTGNFVLRPFSLTVNGKKVSSPGAGITVEAPQRTTPVDTLASRLYDEILNMEKEVSEKKENAFLALSTDRDTVFVGEGFTLTLALYVAGNNEVEMRSFEEGAQLMRILRKLKPADCWEQDFNIREFITSQVTVNRKKYTQYKMYQAAFYPFSPDTIRLPAVDFRLLRQQASPDPKAGPRQDTVTFFSQPRVVYVKSLPPHPLREDIPVGNFWLEEAVSRRKLLTGEPFTYQFDVWGEGNLSTVSVAARTGNAFDFYPPEIKVNVNTASNRPAGRKTFRFTAIPREPGRYALDTVFRLIYFNPARRQYDTLHSRTVLEVTGQSLRNVRMQASEIEPVYRDIGAKSNQLRPLYQAYPFRQAANVLLVLMLLTTLVLMGYKK